ncbi:hypothetical protein B4923_17685 [Brenneria roseae subsp. americana]|uniref:Uncharacterized protein n=1 Tax=Brenneria roseae subsp. americana TaxID=1508507 RepID=A0A2U1TKN4_9GAMM|nr:hypothetical protein [Brenneria roseae]PWC09970.1 hypothetical protein B4923_17685 [Brenneria roseae subsp. americana]
MIISSGGGVFCRKYQFAFFRATLRQVNATTDFVAGIIDIPAYNRGVMRNINHDRVIASSSNRDIRQKENKESTP